MFRCQKAWSGDKGAEEQGTCPMLHTSKPLHASLLQPCLCFMSMPPRCPTAVNLSMLHPPDILVAPPSCPTSCFTPTTLLSVRPATVLTLTVRMSGLLRSGYTTTCGCNVFTSYNMYDTSQYKRVRHRPRSSFAHPAPALPHMLSQLPPLVTRSTSPPPRPLYPPPYVTLPTTFPSRPSHPPPLLAHLLMLQCHHKRAPSPSPLLHIQLSISPARCVKLFSSSQAPLSLPALVPHPPSPPTLLPTVPYSSPHSPCSSATTSASRPAHAAHAHQFSPSPTCCVNFSLLNRSSPSTAPLLAHLLMLQRHHSLDDVLCRVNRTRANDHVS